MISSTLMRSEDTAGGSGVATLPPELYEELWWYSGSYTSATYTLSGQFFVNKGSVSTGTSISSPNANLLTLNSNWSANQKYAFEASLQIGTYIAYAALWDITSGTIITSSQISIANSNFKVVRSGQFTLTPGHAYGITIWCSNTSSSALLTDASLIIFPQ